MGNTQAPHLTHWTPQMTVNTSKGLSRVHECDRQQTRDRQTDHAAEQCVAIGGSLCTAKAISLTSNNNISDSNNRSPTVCSYRHAVL